MTPTASGAKVKLTVKVSPNLEKYHKFAKQLDGVLSKAAKNQGKFLGEDTRIGNIPKILIADFSAFRPVNSQ